MRVAEAPDRYQASLDGSALDLMRRDRFAVEATATSAVAALDELAPEAAPA